jgi:hypothetical protein
MPAVIEANGSQMCLKNGEYHRDNDLTALIQNDGYKAWYINGKYIKSTISIN